jgi:hypothetical protein
VTPVLTIYAKPGCHLCDDARIAAGDAADGLDVRIEEVDVSLDPALHRRYGERIPVGELDGQEVFETFVDVAALRARLKSSR